MAKKQRRFKFWLNIIAIVLVALVLFLSRDQLVEAWDNLHSANLWILLLLLPVQVLSYYANGMIIFSYLRGRGKLKDVKMRTMTAMALELNFVNHVFPTGGISGASYMIWRLGKTGVRAGQATMSQIIRYVAFMIAFVILLVISLVVVAITNDASNMVVLLSAAFATGTMFLVIFAAYLIGNRNRLKSFSRWVTRVVNKVVYAISFKRRESILKKSVTEKFFYDIHDDFMVIKEQKSLLLKPIIWAFVFVLSDVALFFVAFLALGTPFNPALLLIAYGAATCVGMFVTTPGGAGGFEGVMILMLGRASAAGVVLARVILILGTLITGYVFYHLAIRRLGDPNLDKKIDLTPNDEIKKAKSHDGRYTDV